MKVSKILIDAIIFALSIFGVMFLLFCIEFPNEISIMIRECSIDVGLLPYIATFILVIYTILKVYICKKKQDK